jgi:leader peptidase (prepilin peptidase)/N-methyltransferase
VTKEPNWHVWPFEAYLLCSLVITVFVDLDHWIIPDKITLPGIAIGFLSSFVIPGFSWIDSLLGIIFGGGSLLFVGWAYALLTKKEGIGGGDIKYLAMAGAFLGLQDVVLILLLSSVVGSCLGLVFILTRGGNGKTAIPFGPFLAAATLIVFLFGDSIWQWYLKFQYVL